MIKQAICVSLVASSFLGCRPGDSKSPNNVPDKTTEVVLARVNDAKLTPEKLEKLTELQTKLLLRKEKSEKNREKIISSRAVIEKKLLNEFVAREVQVALAKASGYQPSAERRAAYEKRVLKFFGLKGETFADFCGSLGTEEPLFRARFEQDLLCNGYIQSVYSNEWTMTEADLDKLEARIKEVNAHGIATNALTRIKLKNLHQRAKAGEDFAKLADAYSEAQNKEPGGFVGDYQRADFNFDPEVWDKLVNLKKGDISEPIETESGFYLYRVHERMEPGTEYGELTFTLSELFLRKAISFNSSRKELKEESETDRKEKLKKRLIKEFLEKATIVHPKKPSTTQQKQ